MYSTVLSFSTVYNITLESELTVTVAVSVCDEWESTFNPSFALVSAEIRVSLIGVQPEM